MKTILVPTDFTKNANNALNYAVSLAKKEKAKIVLLHVFNINFMSPDIPMEYYESELLSTQLDVKKKLDALCAAVNKSGKINCEPISKQGFVIDAILDTIKKKKIDVVVMGTKGASGMKEILMGSNTATIIGKASRPVIAVPAKASFTGIKKIVFATDYHSDDIVALKQLVEIAEVFKSEVNVIHIATDKYSPANEKEFIEKFTKKVKKKISSKLISYQLLYNGNVEKRLEQYLKDEVVDLLAMATKDRGLIERLFGKSITKKLSYHTKVPLIAFHYKK